jgi:hypothetical protein
LLEKHGFVAGEQRAAFLADVTGAPIGAAPA